MKPIDLLNKVLQDEEKCHLVTGNDTSAKKGCINPVTFHRADDTPKNRANVPKWHRKRLAELVQSAVLLEAQTNVCIPRELEVKLNLAVTACDLDAGMVAAAAVREHLVAREVRQ